MFKAGDKIEVIGLPSGCIEIDEVALVIGGIYTVNYYNGNELGFRPDNQYTGGHLNHFYVGGWHQMGLIKKHHPDTPKSEIDYYRWLSER